MIALQAASFRISYPLGFAYYLAISSFSGCASGNSMIWSRGKDLSWSLLAPPLEFRASHSTTATAFKSLSSSVLSIFALPGWRNRLRLRTCCSRRFHPTLQCADRPSAT